MRLARRRAAEAFQHFIDRRSRRNLAALLAAHAVRQREQPAVRTRLRGCSGRNVTETVLVVPPHPPGIAKRCEFHRGDYDASTVVSNVVRPIPLLARMK